MVPMYYTNLSGTPGVDPGGFQTGCGYLPFCLTNIAPFSNLERYGYWYGTDYQPDSGKAWFFTFYDGRQYYSDKVNLFLAWAVRTGDIALDIDTDIDGVPDVDDNCPTVSNTNQFDTDDDSRGNVCDNCILVVNTTQCDSDSDGYGNRCDADMNNNGSTNAQDTTLYRQQLGQPSVGPAFNKADLNCNGTVNAQDTTLFRQRLGQPPGPSGLH
jgi:hypothetical protein